MAKAKMNSRQLQANNTRRKIYAISVSLMEKKGYGGTTIEEICRKAGVSIGTFYNYYKSKEDIFFDIFKKADEYFEHTVIPNIAAMPGDTGERIVTYFKYYAKYNKDRGVENISQLYNTKNRFFAVKGRFMQESLIKLIEEGQGKNQITDSMDSDDMMNFLFIVSRGVVYDWCIHEASYDLEEMMENYIRLILKIMIPGKI